ncbi:MAG: TonB-dependent receptor [Caulobacteraceae bacterium]|nr:TonB-dependent receptor [Caulobacteraceae bacterium]
MKPYVIPLALAAMSPALDAQAQSQPPTPIQDLVVTAQRPAAQTLIDRKVYTVSRDLQAVTGTAADVLNTVPSVSVDADGNPSLRGDGSVTILVNGKPSAQFSGAARGLSLQQFPAGDIDRIEVLTNPPAQYKAEGSGGVINIITKKTRKAGASGGGQFSLGDKRRFVLALNGAYNAGKLQLSGGLGLRQDARDRQSLTDRLEPDPGQTLAGQTTASHQSLTEHQRRLLPSARASLDYDLTSRQSWGASFSHRELQGIRYFDQYDTSGPPGAAPTNLSDRHSDGRDWSSDTSLSAHTTQKLWRPGETLTVSLQRSATRERERYVYSNTQALPAADPTYDDLRLSLDLIKTEISADYDLPLPQDRDLKLGYDLEDDRNAFDNVGDKLNPTTIDPAVTNHFRYRQQVHAGYAQIQSPLGPWRLQAGLRLEATKVSSLQITGNVSDGRAYFAAYPSLSLDRPLGADSKLSLNLSRRVTRPDPEALNPFADHQDTHNLRAGNPDLKPQDTWLYQAAYTTTLHTQGLATQTLGATVYYRFDRDSVTDVTTPVSADVVLVTKRNLPKSRAAGLEFSANGRLAKSLTYALSGNLFYSQIDAGALGGVGLKSTTGVNLKASLDYRPTAADTAQISFVRTDRRLTPQGSISPINQVNLGYRHQIRPDLALLATVTDVLDGQRFHRLVATSKLQDSYLRHQYGRVAYVGLVYTFGAPKKAKPTSFEYEP